MSGLKIFLMIVGSSILCTACDGAKSPVTPPPSAEEISFKVFDQAAPLGDFPSEPVYSVITRAQDWNTLEERIPVQALDQCKKFTKFDGELYLLAFAGVKGSSGYAINVVEVLVVQDQYTVIIAEETPGPNTVVEPAMTLPYILIGIPRNILPVDKTLVFTFKDNNENTLFKQDVQLP